MQINSEVEGIGMLLPHKHNDAQFPCLWAAWAMEFQLNIYQFLCSGMCMYISCGWLIDFVCAETGGWPRAAEGEGILKNQSIRQN